MLSEPNAQSRPREDDLRARAPHSDLLESGRCVATSRHKSTPSYDTRVRLFDALGQIIFLFLVFVGIAAVLTLVFMAFFYFCCLITKFLVVMKIFLRSLHPLRAMPSRIHAVFARVAGLVGSGLVCLHQTARWLCPRWVPSLGNIERKQPMLYA